MEPMTTSAGENRAEVHDERAIIPDDTFASRLDRIRKHFGLTIEQAAERTGLNYGSWSNWERGMVPRRHVEVAERIATTLGVDLNWLLFGDRPRTSAGRYGDTPRYDQVELADVGPKRSDSRRPSGVKRPPNVPSSSRRPSFLRQPIPA